MPESFNSPLRSLSTISVLPQSTGEQSLYKHMEIIAGVPLGLAGPVPETLEDQTMWYAPPLRNLSGLHKGRLAPACIRDPTCLCCVSHQAGGGRLVSGVVTKTAESVEYL